MQKSIAIYPTVAFCFLVNLLLGQDCSASRQKDSLVLVQFFGHLESKGKIANWDFRQPLEQIDPLRLQMDQSGCYVRKIDLENTEIITADKIFPADVLNFGQLEFLDLSLLNIKGQIPEDISILKYLDTLDLSYNKFSGKLPNTLERITNLKQFSVSNNELTGEIPKELFNNQRLLDLNLSTNYFSGNLSAEISKFKNLEYCRLGNNQFTGQIPESIGQLSNLKELNLSNNQFVNKAPDSILQILPLEKLILSGNYLTTIPVYKNPLLQLVDISDNALTFQDLFPIYYNISRETKFYYAPQKKLELKKELYPNGGDKIVLETLVDDDIVDNIFAWYQNGNLLSKTKKYTINSFNGRIHTGNYYCIVQNAMLPQLKLEVNYGNINCITTKGTYSFDLCENDSKTFYGIPFNKKHSSDSLIMQNKNGCDSILYIKANILEASANQVFREICYGQHVDWNGQTYDKPGIYSQSFSNYLGCDSTVIMQLYIMDPLVDNAKISKHNNDQLADISLEVEGGKKPYRYDWSNGNSTATVENLISGIYYVTVTDALNCSMEFSYELKLSTNISESSQLKFTIQPNPVRPNEFIYISLDDALVKDLELSLIDNCGKKICQQKITQENNVFKMKWDNSFPKGIYTILINSKTGFGSAKIISY